MYFWRKLTPEQRDLVLRHRKGRNLPWHTPPHLDFTLPKQYLLSATCYEHAFIIGKNFERMTQCESSLLDELDCYCSKIYAWCVLPNHYHALVKTDRIKELRKSLGKLHGRTSFTWNGEDNCRGRQVWYNCFERPMKSERHFWTTLNYIHNNPVHHGYVKKWQDWPWSSASIFLEAVGSKKAKQVWKDYPLLDYGKKWDI